MTIYEKRTDPASMPLNHEQARAMLQKSFQARLDGFEQRALDAHLAGCSECARYRVEMTTLDRQLDASLSARWPDRRYSPAELDRKLATMQTHVRRNQMFKNAASFARLSAAAVLLIVIIAGLAWISRGFAPRQMTAGSVPDGGSLPSAATLPADSAERISLEEAEQRVTEWVFANNPGMNPSATFPVTEITTDEVWQRLQMQVFKVTGGVQQFQAFLVKNGAVLPIGQSFGGMGVDELLVTDLDRDGQPELLYAFSFGSGISQSSIGLALELNGQVVTHEALDSTYMGELTLLKQDDQTVLVEGVPMGGAKKESLGLVRFIDGRLLILADNSAMETFESERFGVSFLYPAGWVAVEPFSGGEGGAVRYEGPDGFFELAQHAGPGDLSRSCEWQANNGASVAFGDSSSINQPEIQMAELDDHQVCLIQQAPISSKTPAMLFETPDGSIALMSVTPAHLRSIAASMRFTWGTPVAAVEAPRDIKATVSPNLEPRMLGPLTLEEYAIVPTSEDSPTHFEFNQRIPAEVFARRADWREVTMEESAEDNNQRLAPFGYRLELKPGENDSQRADLYRGEELVIGDLNMFFPVSVSLDEQGGGDFVMIVEDRDYQKWQVRKDSLEPWDEMAHRSIRPVMSGPHLLTVERGPADGSSADRMVLMQDGQPVFTYTLAPAMTSEAVKGLWLWDGGTVLEVNGTLFVNGANWNEKEIRADEIFAFNLIDGKPFFFFQRDGQVDAWYNGEELPLGYDEIIHGRCCEPAAFNPGSNADMVWFYARKNGLWYYVELGKFN